MLLVEDEPRAAQVLAKRLRELTYGVDVASDGGAALECAATHTYDAVILDLRLPVVDGFDVCRRLRAGGSAAPVLMLTALDDVESRIRGLDCGADDYVTKPFDLDELLARLRAVLRRGGRSLTPTVLTVGPLTLDTGSRQASVNARLLSLTAREYALLEYLMLNAEAVIGRAEILEHVWGSSLDPASNAVEMCIQRLRRKIDVPGQPSLISTRRAEGYMLSSS